MSELSAAVIILILVPYFLPSIIALFRGKSNSTAIFMLNLFLGWTFIGWVVALIWAVSKDRDIQTIVVNNNSFTDYKTLSTVIPQPVQGNISNFESQRTNNNELQSKHNNAKSHENKIENLQKIKQWLDNGVVTQEEFDEQKRQILG